VRRRKLLSNPLHSLFDNNIGSEGAIAIAKVLTHNKTLTTLL
jgi:hypothetical protein